MVEYIKREDAINVVEKYFTDFLQLEPDICLDGIRSLPDADVVKRKNGKWMQTDAFPHHVYCSVCYKTYIPNSEWSIWEDGDLPRNFCPNCGADMRGGT